MTVLVPLLMGFATRMVAVDLARRVLQPLRVVATISLVASAIPLLIAVWPAFMSLLGNGTLLATAAFATATLLIGHFLGGSARADRIVLALSTSSRHPAIAIAVATVVAPQLQLAAAAILLYMLVSAAVGSVYIAWSKRRRRPAPAAAAHPISSARSLQASRGR